MLVYKVTKDGSWCAYAKVEDAIDHLAADIEAELENPMVGDKTSDIYIEVDEMTEEEYKNLPQFYCF